MLLHRTLRTALAPSLLVLASGLVGCTGAGVREDRPVDGPVGPGRPLTEAPSDDTTVQEQLAQFVRGVRRVDGVQVVEVDLENQGQETLEFAWSVEWFSRSGEEVLDLEGVWTALRLEPGQRASLELVAPAPDADSWKLVAVAQP
jgi:uncharacterized protein YcfL